MNLLRPSGSSDAESSSKNTPLPDSSVLAFNQRMMQSKVRGIPTERSPKSKPRKRGASCLLLLVLLVVLAGGAFAAVFTGVVPVPESVRTLMSASSVEVITEALAPFLPKPSAPGDGSTAGGNSEATPVPTATLTPTPTITPTPVLDFSKPTVQCKDGTLRYVKYQLGACSMRGGIEKVLQPIPADPPK